MGVNSMKINWQQKLTSRKFWLAIVGFVTPLLVIFNVPNITIEQITAIIMSGGALIAYIFSEGMIDAKREEVKNNENKSKRY